MLRTREATGAYFTPEPVVRYIVRHTLDPLLPTARLDRPLRVLEPACGQGVFLIEAYHYLLGWHLGTHIAEALLRIPGRSVSRVCVPKPELGNERQGHGRGAAIPFRLSAWRCYSDGSETEAIVGRSIAA